MSYRLEIGTALLLAVAIAIGIWAANQQSRTPDLDWRTSTYLNGPRGSKALHEVLTGLGRLSAWRRDSGASRNFAKAPRKTRSRTPATRYSRLRLTPSSSR